ncbi:hypothetical protein Taro_022809, partial [Colocasia esculenta]|nr:hypothetical protein [Colocasia esculenta]
LQDPTPGRRAGDLCGGAPARVERPRRCRGQAHRNFLSNRQQRWGSPKWLVRETPTSLRRGYCEKRVKLPSRCLVPFVAAATNDFGTASDLAFDLSVAALLGDNIYNFGELLAHPILYPANRLLEPVAFSDISYSKVLLEYLLSRSAS